MLSVLQYLMIDFTGSGPIYNQISRIIMRPAPNLLTIGLDPQKNVELNPNIQK